MRGEERREGTGWGMEGSHSFIVLTSFKRMKKPMLGYAGKQAGGRGRNSRLRWML